LNLFWQPYFSPKRLLRCRGRLTGDGCVNAHNLSSDKLEIPHEFNTVVNANDFDRAGNFCLSTFINESPAPALALRRAGNRNRSLETSSVIFSLLFRAKNILVLLAVFRRKRRLSEWTETKISEVR